jgi:hypothetical protein
MMILPTSTAVSVQLGWPLLPVSVQENAEVGWNGDVQRLPAESEGFSMFFTEYPLVMTNIAHGIDGPFIDDVPSYKPPFIRDFPWLC